MECNQNSPKANDPKYTCNKATGRWVLKKETKVVDKSNIKDCNQNSPKAKDPKYKCNTTTGRWILKKYKNNSSPIKNKSPYKSPIKNKSPKMCFNSKIQLQPHQVRFVKSFIQMCKSKNKSKYGAIAVHSLGSGKTITAITTSQCYLELYPNDKIIIVTPASLITNFKKEMIKWGVQHDDRYHFFTYDGFRNNPMECSNSLLIVDEAHNLRTEIYLDEKTKRMIGRKKKKSKSKSILSSKGIKAAEIINCSKKARNILLLTGTPIVNEIYDLENLMAMIYKRNPMDKDIFNKMSRDQYQDYFNCAISFFNSTPEHFPSYKIQDVYIQMTIDYLEKYCIAEKNAENGGGESRPDMYYNKIRQATTGIDNENAPKIQWIVNKIISSKSKEKFVVFSHFRKHGTEILEKVFQKMKIKYRTINGDVSKSNRQLFVDEYNDRKIKVLIITRAGGEGLNLLETRGVIITEPTWNETASNQIIGRAIRYKSHENLPIEDRIVDIYRLYMVKPKENILIQNNLTKSIAVNLSEIFKSSDKKPSIDLYIKLLSLNKQTKIDLFKNFLINLLSFEQCF